MLVQIWLTRAEFNTTGPTIMIFWAKGDQQSAEFHTSCQAPFLTYHSGHSLTKSDQKQPGSIAFGEYDISTLSDLFLQFAKTKDSLNNFDTPYLNLKRIKLLLESVGKQLDELAL